MPEMVLTYCVHFCLACCAFSDSYTSVSINLAKWSSHLITGDFKDIKGKIIFLSSEATLLKAEMLVSLQYQEIGEGLNDAVIIRKLKPATAWEKQRWNYKDLRKKKSTNPKENRNFQSPASAYYRKRERAWKLCWLMLFLWLNCVWHSYSADVIQ